ncbi:tyrosine-type recombinase/integrase [Roseobacter weihaiensis]|uniref:tyrosine-type recombinase/integrase n=1 Tax=Roseobacter weihaiensis TaxID=2763262 RepID=UPI001D0B71BE|nr:tyrosine-type recombinase/integrase [Roseobacter sp. H9]
MAKEKPDQTVQSTLDEAAANFVAMITAQGYSTHTVENYARNARKFAAKLECSGVPLMKLDDQTAEELISQITQQIWASGRSQVKYQLERFRDYLIAEHGAPPREPEPIDMSPRAVLCREYKTYLRVQRGLSEETIYHCLRFFDRFLTAKFGAGLGDLNSIEPDDITGFILWLRKEQNAPRDKTGPSHLRNLFQFLFWSGKTERNLSAAVPKARQPKPTGIPRYLEPEEVNRLIEVVRGHKKTGRRNYAMLMLIARLGLRAPEVAAIELDDIDWRAGEILIRGKRQLHDRMPMSSEVGEAIVDYIKNERRGPDRALFVSVKPPFKRFKDAQILRWILRDAYDATGISPPQAYIGTHILRHSLATDMLRKGASLEKIGDVLRHRSAMTTTIYAQYDVDALRSISRS